MIRSEFIQGRLAASLLGTCVVLFTRQPSPVSPIVVHEHSHIQPTQRTFEKI